MIYYQKLSESPHKPYAFGKVTTLLISLGLAFFAASLFLTSLFTSGEDIQGYWILFIGWFGLLMFQFAWFANPLNLLALLLLDKGPITSFLLSSLAFALASQTFSFTEIPIGLQENKLYIQELGLGFYLWYFAQFLFLFATLTAVFKHKKTRS